MGRIKDLQRYDGALNRTDIFFAIDGVNFSRGASMTGQQVYTLCKGADGREIQLRSADGFVQWQYKGDATWTNMVNLSALKGADGRELGIRVSGGYIQTSLTGMAWSNLMAVEDLRGPKGDNAPLPSFTYELVAIEPNETAHMEPTGEYPNIRLKFFIPKGVNALNPNFHFSLTDIDHDAPATIDQSGDYPNVNVALGLPRGKNADIPIFSMTAESVPSSEPADIERSGNYPNLGLKFKIPKGADALPPNFQFSATELAAGSTPTSDISGDYPNYIVVLGIPKGADALPPNIGFAITALEWNATPTSSVSGDYPNYLVTLGIPRGKDAELPVFTISTEPVESDADAGVDRSGEYPNIGLKFKIPRGLRGLPGKSLVVLANGHYGNWDDGMQQYVDSGVAASATPVLEGTPVVFSESSLRTNIQSGEVVEVLFGKIKKWLTDLKALAFKDKVNYSTDIENLPTIPSKVGDLENDSSFVTSSELSDAITNFVNSSDFSTAISDFITSGQLSSAISDFVTSSDLSSAVANFVTSSELSGAIADFVSSSDLSTAISDFVTSGQLSSAISDFVTSSDLSSAVANFVTSSELSGAIADFVSSSDLSAAISDFVTSSQLSNAISDHNVSEESHLDIRESIPKKLSELENDMIATTEEAEAGEDDTKIMTPLKVAQAILILAGNGNGGGGSGGGTGVLPPEAEAAYGVEWDVNVTATTMSRIGNLDLHRALPIQKKMVGCLLSDYGEVLLYLPTGSWLSADRSGASGQVMVEIPAYYAKFESVGSIRRVKISEYALEGYHLVPKMYVSAYEASIQRSTGKLCSVVNMDVDYRGGDNTNYDGTYRTLLGRPVTSMTRTAFRAAARTRGAGAQWNCMDYNAHKSVFWLYTIEYANRNSQAAFNAQTDISGFAQGGLGSGVTTLSSAQWNSFNGYRPFTPCGHSDAYGNGSGETAYTATNLPVTQYVNRYRGMENPFGHVWKWTDGANIEVGGSTTLYVCDDPAYYSESYSGYTSRGVLPRSDGYVKDIVFGTYGEFMPSAIGGSDTTYYADYYWQTTTASLRGVLLGGAANYGTHCGLSCAAANSAPSVSGSYVGFAFYPRDRARSESVVIPRKRSISKN
jgi:hypothetical protein